MLTTLLAPPLALAPTLAAFSGGILWAILGISFLIFIHEYGHYSACRLTGTRVETFSIGFGPRLFGWESPAGGRRRLTFGKRQLDPQDHAMDFRIALVPLGGYVKMAGENPGEVRSGAPDEFGSKTIPQRLLIVSAGVIMNAITAFAFYAVCHGGGIEKDAPVVGFVQAGSPAWEAGLQPGDRVRAIDGAALDSFTDLRVEAAFLPPDTGRPIVVERDGRAVTLTARARYSEDQGIVKLGVGPAFRLAIGTGADAFVVGAAEAVRVDGRLAHGGLAAQQRILEALADGKAEVVVERVADGARRSVRLETPAAGGSVALPWRLGVRSAGPAVVAASRARAAGLIEHDRIEAVVSGGTRHPVADRASFHDVVAGLSGVEALEVVRAGAPVRVEVVGAGDPDGVAALLGDIAFAAGGVVVTPSPAGSLSPHEVAPVLLRQVGAPAEGVIPPGSRVLALDGRAVARFEEIAVLLAERDAGTPITLRIQAPDDAKPREVTLTPTRPEVAGSVPLELVLHKERVEGGGLGDHLAYGAARLWREVENVFRTIGGFFSGRIAFSKNVAGPITLVTASSKASEEGFLDLLWFLAYISVMLAVLNILPIPVLDGGHVVFLIAEKIRGKPLSDAVIGRLQLVGMVLLLTLMFFALKNDVLINILK